MKVSISSYSFHTLTESGRMTTEDCVRTAKEMGFDGIEFSGLLLNENETIREAAERTRETCERFGIPAVNYTIGADFFNGYRGGDPENEAERLKGEVDIAAILGVKGMRHDATQGYWREKRKWRGFDDMLPLLAKGCREVTEYAAAKGIRTMVENHGYFSQDSDRVEKLVNAVAHENFGLLCDIGNFLCVDEDPVTAVGRVAPYTVHVHAKDFHVKSGNAVNPGKGFFPSRGGNYLRGAVIGHGDVPVTQCLRVLKAAGYDGYVSIEFEGLEQPMTGVAIGLENLRRYIG